MNSIGMSRIPHQYLAIISGLTALICSFTFLHKSHFNYVIFFSMLLFLICFSHFHFRTNHSYFSSVGIAPQPYLLGISIFSYSIFASFISSNNIDALLFLSALALADCEDTSSNHLSTYTIYFLYSTFLFYISDVVHAHWFRYFLVIVSIIIFLLPHSINVPEADRMGGGCLLCSIGSLGLLGLPIYTIIFIFLGFVLAIFIAFIFFPKKIPFFSLVSPLLTIYLTLNFHLVGKI